MAAAALSGPRADFLHPSVPPQISFSLTTRLAIRIFRLVVFAWPADVAPVKACLGWQPCWLSILRTIGCPSCCKAYHWALLPPVPRAMAVWADLLPKRRRRQVVDTMTAPSPDQGTLVRLCPSLRMSVANQTSGGGGVRT